MRRRLPPKLLTATSQNGAVIPKPTMMRPANAGPMARLILMPMLVMASSGMTFSLVPVCNTPTVTTAAAFAATSRDTMEPQDDGIDAYLWHRAMCTTPEQTNLKTVGRASDRSGASGDSADGADHDMLANFMGIACRSDYLQWSQLSEKNPCQHGRDGQEKIAAIWQRASALR